MTMFRSLVAGVLGAVLMTAPAVADPHGGPRGGPQRDADRAFRDAQQGRAMPLPQLENRVRPYMGGADYLGPELSGGTYRLKFMQEGRVIWVDVDSQTGRIIRRSH
jgi:hypothetical protein